MLWILEAEYVACMAQRLRNLATTCRASLGALGKSFVEMGWSQNRATLKNESISFSVPVEQKLLTQMAACVEVAISPEVCA